MKKNSSHITRAIVRLAAMLLLIAAMGSCIHNDIPYPRIQANFSSIEAEGQTQGAQIDTVKRTVTLYFPEEVDLQNVHIESYTLSPTGSKVVSPDLAEPLDISDPIDVTLQLYQNYVWTISAVQNIERYFSVEGQIGASTIDVPAKRVVAYVNEHANIRSLLVESLKLGPVGATYTPDAVGRRVDFSQPLTVNVTAFGRTERWSIYVEVTESSVKTTHVDPWTCVAWAYGEAQAGKKNGFEYRIAGDTQWTPVPDEWVTHNGGSFYARIIHLSPMTTYQVRALSNGEAGETLEFTTGNTFQMPNSNFDQWWLNGKVWCPWAEGGTPYWDTGNKGATTVGPSNSVPTDETVSGTGWAAKLETVFAGIGPFGKLAAGNIFVGSYVRTDGTNGVLSFGRPCNVHPVKLKGYFRYYTAPISSVASGFADMKGQPDTCAVWCALIDTPEPFEIRTAPANRQLFDPDGDYVVAYGCMQCGETVENYTPFEFTLNYKSTSRVPKYIICTGSASKYGDYFTGGNGAILYLDNLELVYDY